MDFSIATWQRLTERVYLTRCEPDTVNIGLVVGEEHALLIDTGSHPRQGAELARSAARLIGHSVDRVVVTHWHRDHWFGLAGVQAEIVIGHESLQHLTTDPMVHAQARELGLEADQLIAPNHPISLIKAFELGGIRVEIMHLGPAHTATDLIVVVPEEKVIFTGDLIESAGEPQFGSDTSIRSWPMVLESVLGIADDDTVFVPGHGDPVDQEFAFRQSSQLAMVYSEITDLVRRGVGLDEAEGQGRFPFTPPTVAAALRIGYAELAKQGIRPVRQLPLV